MHPIIVTDIGGTNARFAVAHLNDAGRISLSQERTYPGADFDSFEAAFACYRAEINDAAITSACIAIASPIVGDAIAMTNLPWAFSIAQARKDLSLDQMHVINDFHAVALGTCELTATDLASIKSGHAHSMGNRVVLGAGTGLGVAGLTYCSSVQTWLAISGLGGHANLAASDSYEVALIDSARAKFGHVSAEIFLCGMGLVNLYHAVCDVEGQLPNGYSPADITERGLQGTDPLCEKTLAAFCGFLGAVSGNLALTFGARGGVFVAGGIVPRFVDYVRNSTFNARFIHKGPMSDFVADIPVDAVMHSAAGLLGAAYYARGLAASS